MCGLGRHRGFTYLGILFLVAILGTALAATGIIWSSVHKREKEQELLFIGSEFQKAIGSYYESTPGIIKRYPSQLKDLLKDNRHLATVRHLRRLYKDPVTLNAEWGVVRAPDGGVSGVFSLSGDTPMKRDNFSEAHTSFKGAGKYYEWKFIYVPSVSGF